LKSFCGYQRGERRVGWGIRREEKEERRVGGRNRGEQIGWQVGGTLGIAYREGGPLGEECGRD
jgi:hypothetical protein